MIAVICSCVSSVRSSRSCAPTTTAHSPTAARTPIHSAFMTPPSDRINAAFLPRAALEHRDGRCRHHDAFLRVPHLDPFQELVADIRDFTVLPGAHHDGES